MENYIKIVLTFISTLLLYLTLCKQRKENHRNWFDAGLERRIHSLGKVYEEYEETFHRLSAEIIENCCHSPFDEHCNYGEAKIELSNLYVDNQIGKDNIVESLYFHFKSTVIYILTDKCFDKRTRQSYLNEMEQFLHQDFVNVMLCVMCYLNEDDTISLLGKHKAFFHYQSGCVGIDIMKDGLFSYHKNDCTQQIDAQI